MATYKSDSNSNSNSIKNKSNKYSNNVKSNKWRILCCLLTVLTFTVKLSTAEPIPSLCDAVECPSMSELSCPEDSEVREILAGTVELLQAAATQAQAQAPAQSAKEWSAAAAGARSANATSDELFALCCLAKKCVCKTCYIRDCHEKNEVVVELEPENMNTPGFCCGKYECMPEPNCTEVYDTQHYWLRECKRCKCYSGQQICHVSCDDATKDSAMCNSKNLNMFFHNGDSWKDGCYDCKCVNGEEKCVIPFCAPVSCPERRQVTFKDSCCPTCWPKGKRMPNRNGNTPGEEDDEDYMDESETHHNYEDSVESLPPLLAMPTEQQESELNHTVSSTTTAVKPSTLAPDTLSSTAVNENIVAPADVASESPCAHANDAKSYPEVVEVLGQQNSDLPYYITIGLLVVVIVGLFVWNIQLRAKQRSYRPVSNFDDNFNKMSTNIKKMNEFA